MPLSDRIQSYFIQARAALRLPGRDFHIEDEWATLHAIRDRRASMARFGDGELMLMLGHGIYFQEYDRELASRLRSIIRQPTKNFLIGLPPFDGMSITKQKWQASWARYRRLFSFLVQQHGRYHSAAVSRPAMVRDLPPIEFYEDVATLWDGRDVVIVHHTEISPAHPMLRSARTVRHITCLKEHAFRQYASLLQRATAAHTEFPDALFLIAAGPTACLLAWDLAQLGAQALDVGHMMSAYDKCIGDTPVARASVVAASGQAPILRNCSAG